MREKMPDQIEAKLKQIKSIKQEEYGSFSANMKLIGKVWSALLGLKNDIPGWLVALMYASAKIIRAKNKFKEDNYDDAEIYIRQAREMQKTNE